MNSPACASSVASEGRAVVRRFGRSLIPRRRFPRFSPCAMSNRHVPSKPREPSCGFAKRGPPRTRKMFCQVPVLTCSNGRPRRRPANPPIGSAVRPGGLIAVIRQFRMSMALRMPVAEAVFEAESTPRRSWRRATAKPMDDIDPSVRNVVRHQPHFPGSGVLSLALRTPPRGRNHPTEIAPWVKRKIGPSTFCAEHITRHEVKGPGAGGPRPAPLDAIHCCAPRW